MPLEKKDSLEMQKQVLGGRKAVEGCCETGQEERQGLSNPGSLTQEQGEHTVGNTTVTTGTWQKATAGRPTLYNSPSLQPGTSPCFAHVLPLDVACRG